MKQELKILDPLDRAFEKMVKFCFQPFDFAKWLVMGFVTWIVFLGEGAGGGNFNTGGGGNSNSSSGASSGDFFGEIFAEVKTFIENELNMQIIVFVSLAIIVLILVGIAIWVVISWVKSRFEFIFLDDIVFNKYQIANPWRKYEIQGNSLWKWRIVFTLITVPIMTFLVLLTLGVPLYMCWSSIKQKEMLPEAVTGIILGVILLLFTILIVIIISIIGFFVRKLIVPLMYKEKLRFIETWRRFKLVLKTNKKEIFLFLLTYWGLSLGLGAAAGLAVIIIYLVTCCFCLVGALPFISGYITAILMLPLTIFFRYYCYEFIAQIKLPEYSEPGNFESQNAFEPKDL